MTATPTAPAVSVVLGTYNRLPFLRLTLDSIRRELDSVGSGEIIVVDGGSTDGSLKWLTRQKDVVTIIQHNRGTWGGRPIRRRSWGYFMNLGFRCAQGKYVCMVSDDCLLVPGALVNGIRHFDDRLNVGEKVGAVAFYWRNWPEQKRYWVGYTLGKHLFVNHGLFLAEALVHVDFIDEERYLFYHADGDLCLKLWDQGWSVIDCPDAFVEHCSHANPAVRAGNNENQQRDWSHYLDRWTALIDSNDPESLGGWIEKDFTDPAATVAAWLGIQRDKAMSQRAAFQAARIRRRAAHLWKGWMGS